MFRKTERRAKTFNKTWANRFKGRTTEFDKDAHLEIHLITTYWFLFIPIYKKTALITSAI